MSKKLLTFRCPREWAEKIDSLSEEQKITRTDFILKAIYQRLEKQNPQDLVQPKPWG